jgi:hypothetical protein
MGIEKIKEIKKVLNTWKIVFHGITNADILTLINELEKENKDYYDRLNNLQTYIDNHEEIWKGNTKIQLKQFAERLKKKVKNFCGTEYENAYYDVTKAFACNDIDEALKEFLSTTV